MTSKRFVIWVACVVTALGAAFVFYNLSADDFGLFGPNVPKRIWTQEKSSKYLLSFRYIPRNFDGLLIGPSHSDRLDTRRLEGYRIYNLSMDGANATELRAAALTAIERGQLQFIILCLDPYITKNSGFKSDQINAKEYWGSLFSLLPLKLARAKLEARRHPDRDVWADSTWGYENRPGTLYSWDGFIQKEKEDTAEKDPKIDPLAYRHLGDIVEAAHRRGIKVFAYFFPLNVWILQDAVESGAWDRYRQQTLALFDAKRDTVWDMTQPDYDSFRQDPGCYTDGHPSAAGTRLIIADIHTRLDAVLKGMPLEPVFPRTSLRACSGTPGSGSGYDHHS